MRAVPRGRMHRAAFTDPEVPMLNHDIAPAAATTAR
jgi:hypothetical protein